jgi:hypothetical protein
MDPNSSPIFKLPMIRGAVILPTIVCAWYLWRLWWKAELYGAQELGFALWFVVSLVTTLVSTNTSIWIAGFLGQVALAIVLVLKHQIDNIY